MRLAFVFLFLLFSSAASAQTSPDAAALYRDRCATCHGASGRGDGPASPLLDPRPRDFTQGRFKLRTTETGSLPTDEDIARSITGGLHGTSMPGWEGRLTLADVTALVGFLKTFSPRFASEQPARIGTTEELTFSPANVDAGRTVYETLKCAACHGSDGQGTGAIAQLLRDDWGRASRATKLTEPWTFRGGQSVRDIYLRFRTGMNGTPMPSFRSAASEQELWQLAIYVKSMARRPVWELKGSEVVDFYAEQRKQASADRVRHGEYLAAVAGCAFCHSPVRDDNTMIEELKFAGGQRFRVVPFGDFVSYNLTPDKETGLGGWTDEQIKTFLTRGIRPDGSRMLPFPMPWPNYAHMSADDLDALIAYLRALPPVSNQIPPPDPPNIVSYLWGKFQMLILGNDPPLYLYPGNAGSAAMVAR